MNSSLALVFLACLVSSVVSDGEPAPAPASAPKFLEKFNNFNNNAELMSKLKQQLGERNQLFEAVQDTTKKGTDFARGVLGVATEFGRFGIDAMKTVMEHENGVVGAKNDDFFAKVRKNLAERAQNLRNNIAPAQAPAAQ